MVAGLWLVFCAVAAAETPETAQAGGDFTFKRVGPPGAGAGKRIKVQIDPDAEVFRITPGSQPRRPGGQLDARLRVLQR